MSTPAIWGWKRRVADALTRAHVLAPAVSLYQTALGVRGALAARGHGPVDGPPVPPAQLRVRIGPAHADLQSFLRSGEQDARLLRDLLARDESTPEQAAPLLDFGCGCGRVARHWHGTGIAVNGCDVTPRMVEWCRRNLDGEFEVNRMAPPLGYADGSFGLVYAFSVFTHLPEQLQHDWIREFERVLRPGGYLVFSTMGDLYTRLGRLTRDEQAAYDAGRLVVLFEDHAGESFCSAYHPPAYVEHTLARSFDYLHRREGGDNETHDVHLLRKPSSP